ncbi:TolC family protein [Roseivirga sp. BDSF3-8]|uniref:TolC family protein n=1 Tax=Roseivirga sp. BDSF3-8 TaxID=3241598 RepID=UPI0035324860
MNHMNFFSFPGRVVTAFIFMLMAVGSAFAQTVDYNKIILPEGARDIEYQEKLVQLAWANLPSNAIIRHNIAMAEEDLTMARWAILDNFTVQGNLNEFTLEEATSGSDVENARAAFFPRYNFNATLSLGMLVNLPAQRRKSRQQLLVEKERLNEAKIAIRAETLRRYQEYITAQEIYKLETEALEDVRSAYTLAEQQFRNGELTLEEFNGALRSYNEQRIKKLNSENTFMITKINLEEMIGVRLEEVR